MGAVRRADQACVRRVRVQQAVRAASSPSADRVQTSMQRTARPGNAPAAPRGRPPSAADTARESPPAGGRLAVGLVVGQQHRVRAAPPAGRPCRTPRRRPPPRPAAARPGLPGRTAAPGRDGPALPAPRPPARAAAAVRADIGLDRACAVGRRQCGQCCSRCMGERAALQRAAAARERRGGVRHGAQPGVGRAAGRERGRPFRLGRQACARQSGGFPAQAGSVRCSAGSAPRRRGATVCAAAWDSTAPSQAAPRSPRAPTARRRSAAPSRCIPRLTASYQLSSGTARRVCQPHTTRRSSARVSAT